MSYNCIIVGNTLHVKNNNKIYPTKNGAYMNIVERIRDLCTQNKTTIKALERELNIANGSIRNWEANKPSVEKVLLVSQRFNVSIDWLVTGKESGELTLEEKKLVDLYRSADERGKRTIFRTAEAEGMEQELSDSMIG